MQKRKYVARLSCPVFTTQQHDAGRPALLSGRKVCVECPAPSGGLTILSVAEASGVMKCYMSDSSSVDATQTTEASIEFVEPISMPKSSAPQYANANVTVQNECPSDNSLGSQHCWHDAEDRWCGGPPWEAGCTCACKKCPDGFHEDRTDGRFRCKRACPTATYDAFGMCWDTGTCPAGTTFRHLSDGLYCFNASQNGQSLEDVEALTSITCPGGAKAGSEHWPVEHYHGGVHVLDSSSSVKCYAACPTAKPRLENVRLCVCLCLPPLPALPACLLPACLPP